MDLSKLTQRAREGLRLAQVKALRYGHQQVDGEHLLLCLLEQENGLIPRLLERIGAPVPQINGLAHLSPKSKHAWKRRWIVGQRSVVVTPKPGRSMSRNDLTG